MPAQTLRPTKITLVESVPSSVVKYRIKARYSGGPNDGQQLTYADYDFTGSPQDILIGSNGFFTDEMSGLSVRFYVQEQGHDGEFTDEQPIGDSDGHGVFTISANPNGSESAILTY